MRVYEATYILKPDMEEDQVEKAKQKFSDYVTRNGGKVVNIDNWGKRKLAYEIDGHNEGIYILMKFNANPESVESLQRDLRISDDVIKSIVLKLN